MSEQHPNPTQPAGAPASSAPPVPPPPAEKPLDPAAARGLPPDSGPEQDVIRVRPSFFRAKPIRSGLWLAAPVAIAVGAYFVAPADQRWTWVGWATLVAGVVGWGSLAITWFVTTRNRSLRITNKRVVEIRGLFSRSSDEVLHDHIRNVQVTQSFVQRILGVGKIGIASAGADKTEIEMEDLPRPDYVREIIDLYRDDLYRDGPSAGNSLGE